MRRIAIWNGNRQAWESPLGSIDLFSTHSDVYLETWPSSGMWEGGSAYVLQTPALPTADSGSSSLPTPRVASDRTSHHAATATNSKSAPSLGQAVELMAGKIPREFATVDEMPTGWQRLLPTPMVSDANGALADGGRDHPQLRSVLLPTPRASDGEKGGPNQRGSKGDLTMSSAVLLIGESTSPPSDDGST